MVIMTVVLHLCLADVKRRLRQIRHDMEIFTRIDANETRIGNSKRFRGN